MVSISGDLTEFYNVYQSLASHFYAKRKSLMVKIGVVTALHALPVWLRVTRCEIWNGSHIVSLYLASFSCCTKHCLSHLSRRWNMWSILQWTLYFYFLSRFVKNSFNVHNNLLLFFNSFLCFHRSDSQVM